jgi:ATP-dependent DNA ligase
LRAFKSTSFVLDGELVIPEGDTLSFDALQARLHPADSRIRRLADETPATLIAFDCLLLKARRSLLDRPFQSRRTMLEDLFAVEGVVAGCALTPGTRDLRAAMVWLSDRHVSIDGVVAKRLDLAYQPGQRAMQKIKHLRTADCVVGGFRYESDSRLVGSLLVSTMMRVCSIMSASHPR